MITKEYLWRFINQFKIERGAVFYDNPLINPLINLISVDINFFIYLYDENNSRYENWKYLETIDKDLKLVTLEFNKHFKTNQLTLLIRLTGS